MPSPTTPTHPRLANAVDRVMARAAVPGLSLVVVDRERVLHASGHGFADLGSGTAATPETAYLWFSMTKVVTATAALRLADEGLLDLDAPAGEYLPLLSAEGRPRPTVRQLLYHTSGLANPLPIRWAHPATTPAPDPGELLERLLRRRRAFRSVPGRVRRYSNVGYLALGSVIAAAAGRPYQDVVVGEVLAPLGMTRTAFRYLPGAERATGYVRGPRALDPLLRRLLPSGIAGERTGGYLGLNPFHVDGPAYGGLVGDVLDVGRFLRLHLRDGELDGHRVLTEPAARDMRRLGLGWHPGGDREPYVGHLGGGAGFWNVMRLYPERGIGVAIMTNSTTGHDHEALFALVTELFGRARPRRRPAPAAAPTRAGAATPGRTPRSTPPGPSAGRSPSRPPPRSGCPA